MENLNENLQKLLRLLFSLSYLRRIIT